MKWLLPLLLALPLTAQVVVHGGVVVKGSTSLGTLCGPPTYVCSQQSFVPLPVIQPIMPDLGGLTGANTLVVPEGWTNRLVRLTDVNTSSGSFASKSYDLTDSGGGKDLQWNSDDTMLSIINSGSSKGTVVVFDPTTMHGTNSYPALQIPTGRAWSKTNPKYLRTLDSAGSGTAVKLYDFSPAPPSVTITTDFDYHSCPGISGITAIWSAPLSSTTNDELFATGFSTTGGQDTGTLVVAYRPSDGACQVFDTNACTITGSGGLPSGPATTCYPFTVHDVVAGPGEWAQIGVGDTCTGCPSPHGPFFWKIKTTTVNLALANSGGHNALGYSHWWNINAAPVMCGRLFTDMATCSPINDGTGISPATPQDTHCGAPNMNPDDSAPLFCSQASTPNPAAYGATYTSPLQNMVYGIFPQTGKYLLVNPTFTTGYDNAVQGNFRAEYAIPAISQTGRFVAFPSDGMGTFGNKDGTTLACVSGGWPWNASRAYALNYQIGPAAAVNPAKHVFKATACAGGVCTQGATQPTPWPQTLNATITDGTITWTDIGPPTCRWDILVSEVK